MSKTYKDRPDKYRKDNFKKKLKDKRFVSSKGREKEKLKNDVKEYT
mgnify:CR=1 FL=1